jgi:SRSO17 transposase
LDQIREACEAGLPRGIVLMDAGYGANTDRTAGYRAPEGATEVEVRLLP